MQLVGPKWTRLAEFFPGKTDIQVKNRWMQKFARFSSLHVPNRSVKLPVVAPVTMPAEPVLRPVVEVDNEMAQIPTPDTMHDDFMFDCAFDGGAFVDLLGHDGSLEGFQ